MNGHLLDNIFRALSHPARRSILLTLAIAGPLSVGDLAKPFKISEPAVIKHLSVLEKAELLTIERDGQIRRRALNASPLIEAFKFIGKFSELWESNFNGLDDLLEFLQKNKGGKNVRTKKLCVSTYRQKKG